MADPLVLPAKLDLSEVATLHKELLSRQDQDVTLDLSGTSHLGALCLQVIIAAARQTKGAGNQFSMHSTNDQVLAQLAVMGTSPEMIMEGQT